MTIEGSRAIDLPGGVVLAEGESVVADLQVKASLVQFGSSEFVLTNRRIAGIYYTGMFNSEEFQYPLSSVASSGIRKGVSIRWLIFGAILSVGGLVGLLFSLAELSFGLLIFNLVIGALGVLTVLGSFRATISITNNAGQMLTSNVQLFDRSRAEGFFRQVSTQLASG